VNSIMESLRGSWEGLNERERRLVGLMGLTLVGLVIFGIFYLSQSAVTEVEEENQQLESALADIGRARARLEERAAEREAAERRYTTKAPSLGSFVEASARENELTLREVVDQPEEVSGRYTRRAVNVQLPNVNLRPIVDLMAAIENSPYPVAIEQIQVEHFQAGDQYNVKLGVVAYDRAGTEGGGPTKNAPSRPVRGAGPPRP
jgi:type II secretory pathway component PulM